MYRSAARADDATVKKLSCLKKRDARTRDTQVASRIASIAEVTASISPMPSTRASKFRAA